LRHKYPGMTAAQQGSWQTFFDRVRNLKATLGIASLNVVAGGASADATVSGVYEYDNASTGRAERRPATFRATLAHDANGWRSTAGLAVSHRPDAPKPGRPRSPPRAP